MEANSKKKTKNKNTGLVLKNFPPLNENQKKFYEAINNYEVISLTGYAGTGKSFIALYKSLDLLTSKKYSQILVIRSSVPSRDIGFLPGNKKEKMEVYEGPYNTICTKLYDRSDAYQILKQKEIIKFESTSFLRGETFDNMVIIVEESQNLSWMELYTILTRIGDNCKVILTGDLLQDDLTSERFKEVSGYLKTLAILDKLPSCKTIKFGIDDICRSGFVRDFIIESS